MPSSISSFDTAARRLPRLSWARLLGGALLLAGAFVLLMEGALALRGFRPTIVDSQAQWNKQRARAAQLGGHALVVVGDSRMQTDLDFDALRAGSGLQPVELAIDGSSFVPVLAGLARDANVTGTVLVGFSEAEVLHWNAATASARYEADYRASAVAATRWTYRASEEALDDRLRSMLASYADGARPLTTLLLRLLDRDAQPQYIVTHPDRTRSADYSGANLRSLRLRSARFEMDDMSSAQPAAEIEQRERSMLERIAALQPADAELFAQRGREIEAMTRQIQARGGRVVFVRMPVGSYVAQIDARLYPRQRFWDSFAAASSAYCLDWDAVPALRQFVPPDDLHLDQRDRRAFSASLISAAMSAPACAAAAK